MRQAYDIIGDIHGCGDELVELLLKLGYVISLGVYMHPRGRKAVFLGDIADRGPRIIESVEIVLSMVEKGSALYVPGNHCNKIMRFFEGRNVQIKHGLEKTIEELEKLTPQKREEIRERFVSMVRNAPPYLMLDDGRLAVAHAGIEEHMMGKVSKRIESFCLYGDPTGEVTAAGTPVRRDWASDYRGKPLVVYGHTPVSEPEFINNTIDIDQGCAIGGALTALRYPELELVQVKARRKYYPGSFHRELITRHRPLS